MDAKAFGQLVRGRRKAIGMTQQELALTIGSGVRFIVDLETGKETCQLGKALAAARAVGIDLADAAEVTGRSSSQAEEGYDLSFTRDGPTRDG
jgi:HTH-type transcriptional regulator / antitoxin HipB